MTPEVLRILVVDDERLARGKIARHLREFPRPFAVTEAKNGLEALAMIQERAPDIVFLDVEMPGLSGFDLLRQLVEVPFQVIFQTAFDEFAVRAFEENACDYLLKPFTADRLHKALARALARTAPPGGAVAAASAAFLDRITVRQGRELLVLPVDEIHCFVSRDHYTCVHTDAGEFLIELSLNHLETHLDPAAFERLHRNAPVRAAAIKALSAGPASRATLVNGMQVDVSRAHRQIAKKIVKR